MLDERAKVSLETRLTNKRRRTAYVKRLLYMEHPADHPLNEFWLNDEEDDKRAAPLFGFRPLAFPHRDNAGKLLAIHPFLKRRLKIKQSISINFFQPSGEP